MIDTSFIGLDPSRLYLTAITGQAFSSLRPNSAFSVSEFHIPAVAAHVP